MNDREQQREGAFEMARWQAPEVQGEWGLGDALGRIAGGIGQAVSRAAAALGGANIIDLTAKANPAVRKGVRDMAQVKALVLHQMGCCFQRRDPMSGYLRLKAHYAILPDGRILQLHPENALIWASNGFNHGGVAVEFAGNFPSTRGQWWEGQRFGRDRVTPAQIDAGRRLVRHLVAKIGLRAVLAHRKSSGARGNDPGPDIWYQVGQWAVDTLGLSDGGPGFSVGSGKAIPDLWRQWGRVAPAVPELEFEQDSEQESALGPLTASLRWMRESYPYHRVARADSVFGTFGGVYIAFRPAPPGGKITVLKVGMSDTFARRMRDPQYVRWSKLYPDLRFYLARVHGTRGSDGVAGVVRMVEYALARLLRRAGPLTGPQLPRQPARTRGAVRIANVLPRPLLALLPMALTQSQAGGQPVTAPMAPGQLVLPRSFSWEAERPGD